MEGVSERRRGDEGRKSKRTAGTAVVAAGAFCELVVTLHEYFVMLQAMRGERVKVEVSCLRFHQVEKQQLATSLQTA
jgi:hypothetical protein